MRIEREQNYERIMKEREDEEYKRRETNNGGRIANSVIPDFQELLKQEDEENMNSLKAAGVVASTDSESESDQL